MKTAALTLNFILPKRAAKKKLTFAEVLTACKAGDDAAQELLYKQFYGYILAVVRRYQSNEEQAEELVNDTFLKIFKGLDKFAFPLQEDELIKAFKGWAGRIASRTVIDFLRVGKNRVLSYEINDEDAPAGPVDLEGRLNVQDILKLLTQLPQIPRLVFNLFEIEGFSHQEIADQLKFTPNHSRAYLARAKSTLRILYQEQFKTLSR